MKSHPEIFNVQKNEALLTHKFYMCIIIRRNVPLIHFQNQQITPSLCLKSKLAREDLKSYCPRDRVESNQRNINR